MKDINNINYGIYQFVLKKRSRKFHIIMSILTCGIWIFFYPAMKLSYKFNFKNGNVKKMIDSKILPYLERDAKLRRNANRNLVKVTTHGGSCDRCKKWEGKILNDDIFTSIKPNNKYDLLSNAIKDGLLHEGCRHGLMTYYSELEGVKYNEPGLDIELELQRKLISDSSNSKSKRLLIVDEDTGEVLDEIK